ncbi:hypothetical protein COCSUDRAFT_34297 [Coccomyxa subellipsoidea C-169]|uniref:Uncharacterized protein n=1 Tax=Coccomyxa subellipsoidea (strain C-169) TaxID=574566 RepID=I0YLZ9_COCSC|nr:hypothetical protein COCSUDRAFT_34297 [Coccomyxa subellipsoidea C-169]EIE19418.1 hypothetical protein COCSUDRAFT_34297 [Coccomyxa subellipsoidea C-169]|eukprot:XP_005643962.1 hypothetical protein COCSUDRAFT_34297 [Coccomyxa subellipsoidea C-169]
MPNRLSLICCPGLLPHPQLKSNLTVLRGPQELSYNSFMSADAKHAITTKFKLSCMRHSMPTVLLLMRSSVSHVHVCSPDLWAV